MKFVPISPFAIAQSLQHQTESKHLLSPQHTPQTQPKQENAYMDHSTYIENQNHNQSFPIIPPKPINTITSLYPTLAPYSPHPEHRLTARNITTDNGAEHKIKEKHED